MVFSVVIVGAQLQSVQMWSCSDLSCDIQWVWVFVILLIPICGVIDSGNYAKFYASNCKQ